ncbi:MAG: dihydrofolate reductase family protein [Pyramidobacter porci]|uniref:dihydrofolate reductase family protein n=1 Tax=Pyramidobacter porci TaxID=2605789 RepID=UPI002A759A74|nr:dihydrofolate reductase family protein [Pyramidobacter porci]MDY2647804.1 dihydrofolate reductase family protein [Pyramidobacter porci]
MKDRARVICHMMTTIDGKIDVEFEPSAEYDKVGDEYDRLLFSYGQAYGLGRTTCQSDLGTDLSKYKGVPVKFEDTARRYPAGTIICVAFDRWGKLRWDSNVMEYAGRQMPIVEAVTEKCAPEFLAYLRDLKIPCIVAGTDNLDLELFLQKIKSLCGVETFVIGGGAQINGEFIRRGLADEISLVVAPAVDGTRGALTMAGTDNLTGFPQYYRLKNVQKLPCDGLLIRWSK